MNPYILLAKGAVEKYLQQGKIMFFASYQFKQMNYLI